MSGWRSWPYLLVSFDPFFLGHSRLLNHEAMMTLFVLVAVLGLLVHLFSRRGVSLAGGFRSGGGAGAADEVIGDRHRSPWLCYCSSQRRIR